MAGIDNNYDTEGKRGTAQFAVEMGGKEVFRTSTLKGGGAASGDLLKTWKRTAREHPEFVFGGKQGGLFKLNDPAARRFLTDLLSQRVTEYGLDVYRNDFNIDPARRDRVEYIDETRKRTETTISGRDLAAETELRIPQRGASLLVRHRPAGAASTTPGAVAEFAKIRVASDTGSRSLANSATLATSATTQFGEHL